MKSMRTTYFYDTAEWFKNGKKRKKPKVGGARVIFHSYVVDV